MPALHRSRFDQGLFCCCCLRCLPSAMTQAWGSWVCGFVGFFFLMGCIVHVWHFVQDVAFRQHLAARRNLGFHAAARCVASCNAKLFDLTGTRSARLTAASFFWGFILASDQEISQTRPSRCQKELSLRKTREVASGNPHDTRTLSKSSHTHDPVLERSYHIIFAVSYYSCKTTMHGSYLTLQPSVPINEKCRSTVKLFIRRAAWRQASPRCCRPWHTDDEAQQDMAASIFVQTDLLFVWWKNVHC